MLNIDVKNDGRKSASDEINSVWLTIDFKNSPKVGVNRHRDKIVSLPKILTGPNIKVRTITIIIMLFIL